MFDRRNPKEILLFCTSQTSNDWILGGVVWEVWFYFASGDKDRAAKIKRMTPLSCFSSMKKK